VKTENSKNQISQQQYSLHVFSFLCSLYWTLICVLIARTFKWLFNMSCLALSNVIQTGGILPVLLDSIYKVISCESSRFCVVFCMGTSLFYPDFNARVLWDLANDRRACYMSATYKLGLLRRSPSWSYMASTIWGEHTILRLTSESKMATVSS